MTLLLDLDEECSDMLLKALSCRGVTLLRGSCEYWYNYMDETSWWEYYAERYCELFPPFQISQRCRSLSLTALKKKWGHIYDVDWNTTSYRAFMKRQWYTDDDGVRRERPRWRWRRRTIKADLVPCPPDTLAELATLCIIREYYRGNEQKQEQLERLNNKYYTARVSTKTSWDLWWKYGGNESLAKMWALNPLTGKPIRKDSNTYLRLKDCGFF